MVNDGLSRDGEQQEVEQKAWRNVSGLSYDNLGGPPSPVIVV